METTKGADKLVHRAYWFQPGVSAVLLAISVLSAGHAGATEKAETLSRVTMQEGVAAIACGDQALIGLAGLDYDACIAKSESVAPYCWAAMEPLLPDLRFGQSDFADKENEERVLSTLFVLEKCIQASILLPSDDHDQAQQGAAKIRRPAPHPDEVWTKLVERALSEFTEKRPLLNDLSEAMTAQDLFSVTLNNKDEVLAYRMAEDGTLVAVSENAQSWRKELVEANVVSAVRMNGGIVYSVGLNSRTDAHRLAVSYSSDLEQELPKCRPELQQILCGSCEVDRSDDHRAVVTWFSHEIKDGQVRKAVDGHDIELIDSTSVSMQCWKDGMAQLGFDVGSSQ